MTSWIKRTLIATAALTLTLGGLAACGGHHRDGARHGMSEQRIADLRGKAVERISNKLSLDAAQRAKLDALANEVLAARQAVLRTDPSTAAAHTAGGTHRAQLQALLSTDKFDRAAARRLLDHKTSAINAQGPKVLDAMADFFDHLNPQQQAQVREALSGRGARRFGW